VQASPAAAERRAVVGARNYQHRDRVGIGLTDAGAGVGHAGAGNQRAHAGFAGDAGVAVRHQARALFVARRDRAQLGVADAAVKLERVFTRDPEHGSDAIGFEQLHQGFAASPGHRYFLTIVGFECRCYV
jgi:hypothetical protein